jgi:hypothetical protein
VAGREFVGLADVDHHRLSRLMRCTAAGDRPAAALQHRPGEHAARNQGQQDQAQLAITKSTLKILEQGRWLAARGQSGILEWRMAIVRRLGDGLFHSRFHPPAPCTSSS